MNEIVAGDNVFQYAGFKFFANSILVLSLQYPKLTIRSLLFLVAVNAIMIVVISNRITNNQTTRNAVENVFELGGRISFGDEPELYNEINCPPPFRANGAFSIITDMLGFEHPTAIYLPTRDGQLAKTKNWESTLKGIILNMPRLRCVCFDDCGIEKSDINRLKTEFPTIRFLCLAFGGSRFHSTNEMNEMGIDVSSLVTGEHNK